MVKQIIDKAGGGRIVLDALPAATIDDVRASMLKHPYRILSYSGHAGPNGFHFEANDGTGQPQVPLRFARCSHHVSSWCRLKASPNT